MIVREIIPINTKKSRIIFDDNESFALYKGEMRRLDIEVGREIDEEEYYITIYPTLKREPLQDFCIYWKGRSSRRMTL